MINHYKHHERSEMLALIPSDAQRVLDVGCNTGAFGEGLKARSPVEVWGVEPNPEAAARATVLLDKVINDVFTSNTDIPSNYFDVVVFNDVLEHLVDPWEALRIAGLKLKSGGIVVASIPNILHQENLIHLLVDRDFRYEIQGIRDKTHLRFFTRKSILRLFDESGYNAQSIAGINPSWWSKSLIRRLAYLFFSKQLEDTKYLQFSIVARLKS